MSEIQDNCESEGEGEGQVYMVTNTCKKGSCENEYYTKNILGKRVSLIITTAYRWGEFEVTLTDEEHKKMKSEEIVCINDYEFEFVVNSDGCEQTEEIEGFDEYSDEEKRAICEDIYEDIENRILFGKSELEDDRGWTLNDTIYEIHGGVDIGTTSSFYP